jgi:predicted nuclease of predicted toxin-antitoxin system
VPNGCPPKVIRLKFGNISTQAIIQNLISNIELVQEFLNQDEDVTLK